MKRTERQRLKQNEIANLLDWVLERYDEHRAQANLIGYVIVAVLIAAGGWYVWQQRTASHANAMLADANVVLNAPVVPPAPAANGKPAPPPPAGSYPSDQARLEAALPKLTAAADAYPSTRAGIAARFEEAAALLSLKRPADAARAYQQVIDRASSSDVYAQMAKLGIAEAEAQQTHYDQAIATFKELTLRTDGDLPVDGILMQLGQTYLAAGRKTEAAQAFRRVVQEFPDSPYVGEARRQLDAIEPASAPRIG